MRTLNLFRQLPVWLLGAFLCMAPLTAVYAVDELGLFELNGNPLDGNALGTLPDDWETLCDPVAVPGGPCQNAGPGPGPNGSAEVFTGIKGEASGMSIFDGGKKDIQDVSEWSWKNGSVPDKDDITNAYAAAYLNTMDTTLQDIGDLIIYFGADRFANAGDAFMGFWFFQDDVAALPNGTFSGNHVLGDVLVLVNFPQAANAVPQLQVNEWDPSCPKAANNNPQPGQCNAKNIRLIAGASGAGAICEALGGDQLACAHTNAEGGPDDPVASPWPYVPKAGINNIFPYESFFEGGINISALLPDTSGCFSSFMAETRSSTSFTATLKDFILDDFRLCGASAVTVIHDGSNAAATPHPVIALNSSTAVVGDVIHDSVLVSGNVLGGGAAPTPTSPAPVVFTLYDNLTCDGNVLTTSMGNLSATASAGVASAESANYTLTQTGEHSWKATWAGNNDYPNGAVADCEPFNVIQPKLAITKDVSTCLNPDTLDTGSFNLQFSLQGGVLGTAPGGSNLKDGGSTGFFGVNPGTYVVDETGGSKTGGGTTSLAEYVKVFQPSGDCAGGTVTVGGTDMKTCTIVNVRKPHLIVKKVILGPDGGLFNLQVNGTTVDSGSAPAGMTYVSGDGSDIGNNGTVRVRANTIVDGNVDPADFGNFEVGEAAGTGTDILNYQTSITCDDDAATEAAFSASTVAANRKVSVNMDAGQVVTCTITNIPIAAAAACPVQ